MKCMSILKFMLMSSICVAAGSVRAATFDWSHCKKELAKCKLDPKSKDHDEATWACLEGQGETLSKACEETHQSYEKKVGKKVK